MTDYDYDDDYSQPEWCGECNAELTNGRCWFCDRPARIWTDPEGDPA